VDNVALIITCPHCGRDQSIEICCLSSPEGMPELSLRLDTIAVCDYCQTDIKLHMTLRQRTMLDGCFFGQIPGGPVFPGIWFGTS
jgi:phage terminase large subunit GpA-like protein